MDSQEQNRTRAISDHDKAVLNRLFNPELPTSDVPDETPEPVDGK